MDFWLHNDEGTAFTNPDVLGSLASAVDWWKLTKGKEVRMLWPVPLDSSGAVTLPEFTYYVGPYWSNASLERPASSRYSELLSSFDVSVPILLHRYEHLCFEFPPRELDVRFFSWWNYGIPGSHKFMIEPRYSARIRGLQLLSNDDLLSNFRELRRREIRRALASNVFELDNAVEWSEIEGLYRQVFERQGDSNLPLRSESLTTLEILKRQGFLSTIGNRVKSTGELASVTVLLSLKGETNMLINATATSFQKSGIGPKTVFDAICWSRDTGSGIFDFNGANSPHRGGDKHSYGAEPTLFFQLSYPSHS